ncbi:hypothetical protein F2Q70_00041274 [Brassica cretica]|uniref:RCHY1 zinc-ribbon domain-containing protein n=1 Tax=Brassica cretica TaxID=69181 RepID=A0A8S9K6V6_BRACR|nr:hypothetical protein F2Q70_00041274 [Brassica cretica]
MGEYFCNICNFFDDEVFFCILLLYIVSFSITLLLLGRPQNNNFIVTTVGFVELVGVTISFIAKAVELVIQWACAIITHALRTPLRTLVLSVTRYRCPICYKSMMDMSSSWQLLDAEIRATKMPSEYNYEIEILCNDCNKSSKAMFHILGHKCAHCGSYNTRRISAPQDPPPQGETERQVSEPRE